MGRASALPSFNENMSNENMSNEKPKTIRWMRESGNLIETNDEPATVEHCEAQGWKREGEEGGPAKRGRPAKGDKGEE